MDFILDGEIPTKKNFWKVGRNRQGTAYIYNAKKVKRWEYDNFFLLKSLYRNRPKIEGDVLLETVFYIRRDKDIDNMLGTLQDLIQKVIIYDDKQIKKVIATKVLSPDSQRVFFKIKKYVKTRDKKSISKKSE